MHCHELKNTFKLFRERPDKLHLVQNEQYKDPWLPCERKVREREGEERKRKDRGPREEGEEEEGRGEEGDSLGTK
jgi:hypothetical protein